MVAMELRALVSARSAADAFELRCEVREKLIEFLRTEHSTALPHARAETVPSQQPPREREPPVHGLAVERHAEQCQPRRVGKGAEPPHRGRTALLRLCPPYGGSPS